MIIQDLGQFDGVSKAGNPFKKHEWVLETIGQYPRKVKFTVFGDRVNTVTFETGKRYIVQVDAESREYNGRWYTDLTAFACRLMDGEGAGPQQTPPFTPPTQTVEVKTDVVIPNDFSSDNSQEDLPF